MRAVITHISEHALAARRRTGLDRWDEMWDGELHMPPAPSDEHQRVLDDLIEFLRPLLRTTGRGTLRSGINVFDDPVKSDNYRIPDLTFVAVGHDAILAADGVRGGAPDAVIEIRSPDDETYEKLPFFARVGVREVIVVDRDTKRTEIFRLTGSRYVALQRDREGWLTSEALDVRFGRRDDATLVVQDARDESVRVQI
jgi:Uma2 family endonuclease